MNGTLGYDASRDKSQSEVLRMNINSTKLTCTENMTRLCMRRQKANPKVVKVIA